MTVHLSDSLSNRWYSDSTIGGTPGIGKTVDVTPSVSVGTLTVHQETPNSATPSGLMVLWTSILETQQRLM